MTGAISGPNWIDEAGAALVASSEAGDLSVGALARKLIMDKWRTSGVSPHVVQAALAASREVGFFAMFIPRDGLMPNASSRARLQLSNISAGGSEVLDTGWVSADMQDGAWIWPVGLNVEPNPIYNACGREDTAGWTTIGTVRTSTLTVASDRWELNGQGSMQMGIEGRLSGVNVMDAAFDPITLTDKEPTPIYAAKPLDPTFAFTGWTTTRAQTPAGAVTLRRNATGVMEEVAANIPRLQYDPALVYLGLLHEAATTNQCVAPRTMSDASWVKANLTVTEDSGLCPTGLTQADKCLPSTTAAAHSALASATFVTGTYYTYSQCFRVIGTQSPWVMLQLPTTIFAASGRRATFNTSTGALGLVDAGVVTRIERFNNMWRFSITAKSAAAGTGSYGFNVSTTNSLTPTTTAGNGTDGVEVWGAQVEANNFASMAIMPPVGTIGTAFRDQEYNSVPNAYAATRRFSMYLDRRVDAANPSDFATLVRISNGTSTSHRVYAYVNTTSAALAISTFQGRYSGSTQADMDGPTMVFGVPYTHVLTVGQDNFSAYRNGVLENRDTNIALPSNLINDLQIYSGQGIAYLREVRIYGYDLSQDEAIGLSSTDLVVGSVPIEAMVSVIPKGCEAVLRIRWFDASGAVITHTESNVAPPSGASDGRLLSSYRELRVIGYPPYGAKSYQVVVTGRSSTTSDADPFLIFTRAAVSRAVGAEWGQSFLVPPVGLQAFNRTARYVTWTIQTTTPYFQAGRMWVGYGLFLSNAADYGMKEALSESGSNERSQSSGGVFSRKGRTFGSRTMVFSDLEFGEATHAYRKIRDKIGATGQAVVIPVMEWGADDVAFGRIVVARGDPAYNTRSLEIVVDGDV